MLVMEYSVLCAFHIFRTHANICKINDETGQLVDNALYRYPCDLGIYKRGTIKLLMLFSNKLSQEK